MRSVSASSMARIRQCAASVALPSVNESNEKAEAGTAVHAFVAAALPYGRDAALTTVPAQHREQCEAVDIEAIRQLVGNGTPHCEIAFEYSPFTDMATVIGENIGRGSYKSSPDRIYGTADLLVAEGNVLTVLDFKTGKMIDPARDNWQLRTLALMAARAFGVDEVQIGIVYLWDGAAYPDMATLTALDLDAAAAEFLQVMKRVESARSTVAAGRSPDVYPSKDACQWCNCFAACPAKTALVRDAGRALATLPDRIEALTAEEKGAAWNWLEDAEKALTVIRKSLEAQAGREPFVTPDGRTVAPVESSRKYVNGERAYEVLVKEFGREAVEAAFERSTSAAAIKRALNGNHARAMKLLDEHGAMDVKTTVKVQAVAGK